MSTKITTAYAPATGVLTLTGIDSVSDYEKVLTSIQWEDSATPPDASPRYITVVANDELGPSNTATTTITDPPAPVKASLVKAAAAAKTPASLAAASVASGPGSANLADQVLGSVNNWLAG